MEQLKLTKNELRKQQIKLSQLDLYLPTLKLKKAMLQAQINIATLQIVDAQKRLEYVKENVEKFKNLLTLHDNGNILHFLEVRHIKKTYENIAGVEIPNFEGVSFVDQNYFLFDTPLWMDSAIDKLKKLIISKENIKVLEEKKRALKNELRDVSIRVNLFEKVLIPRTNGNIKKIKIFLGDQQLAAVSQAKVAKMKMLSKKNIPTIEQDLPL
jgi:V/A-type H+/Na+-transporting ATPase subunit D